MLGERRPIALATPPPWGNLNLRMANAHPGWGKARLPHPQGPQFLNIGPGPLWDTSWVTDIYTGPHYFQCPRLKGVDQYPVLVTGQNNPCRLGIVHHLPAWWWLVRTYLLHDFGQNSPAWRCLFRTLLLGGGCSAPTWWWLVSTCLGGSVGQELSMSRPVD